MVREGILGIRSSPSQLVHNREGSSSSCSIGHLQHHLVTHLLCCDKCQINVHYATEIFQWIVIGKPSTSSSSPPPFSRSLRLRPLFYTVL